MLPGAIDHQEQRQAALLGLDRRLGRDGQQVVEHGALVPARRKRARAADDQQPAPEVLDERLQRALLVEAQSRWPAC